MALRGLRARTRTADPIPPAQRSPGTSSSGVAGPPPPTAALPIAHDAQCVHARLLLQAHWQLADARRENDELTVCLRRLLRQLQFLNSLLDPYNLRNAGPAQHALGDAGAAGAAALWAGQADSPALPGPRTPELPFETTRIEKNP